MLCIDVAHGHHLNVKNAIESLKNNLSKMSNLEVFLDIKEVRKPEVEQRASTRGQALRLREEGIEIA